MLEELTDYALCNRALRHIEDLRLHTTAVTAAAPHVHAHYAYSVGVLCQAADYVSGPGARELEPRIRRAAGLLARVPIEPDYPIWAPGWSDLAIKVWGILEVLALDENGERENEPESLAPDALTRTAEDVLKPIASALRHWEFQEKGLRRTTLWVALGRVDCLRHLMMPRTYEPPEHAGGYSRLLEALKHFGMLSPKTEEVVHAVEVAGLYREEAPLSVPPEGLLTADEELLIEGLHRARLAAEAELGQALEQDAIELKGPRDIGTPPDAMEAIRIAQQLKQKPRVELHETPYGPPTEGHETKPAADVHRLRAALRLGIAPEDVTPEQRNAEKMWSFGETYGGGVVGRLRPTLAERARIREAAKALDFTLTPGRGHDTRPLSDPAVQAEHRWAEACHRELDRTEKAILESLGRDSFEETRRLIQAHFEEMREQVYDRVALSRGREETISAAEGAEVLKRVFKMFEAAFRLGHTIGKIEE